MPRYEKYKDSGIEWIGDIPEHWNVKKLKYIGEVKSSSIDKKNNYEVTVLVVHYNDVISNPIINERTKLKFTSCTENQFLAFAIKKGDLIITKDSMDNRNIADISVVDTSKKIVCGYHLYIFRCCMNEIDYKYYFYYLGNKNQKKQFLNLSNGTTIIGLSAQSIMNSFVPVLPYKEQTTIANYLDNKTAKIEQIIKQKEQLLVLYEEEKTAIINQAVTKGINPDVNFKDSGIDWIGNIPEHWEAKKLKYLGHIVLGKMLMKSNKGDFHKRKYLRAVNIGWLDVNVEDIKEMWFSNDELIKLRLNENDLLVSEGGEAGRTCIWKNEIEECYIQNSAHKVTFDSQNNPFYYLYHFYLYGQKGLFDSIVNRISIAHLTVEKIRDIDFYTPPLKEQTTIVTHIETQTAKIDSKIVKTSKLITLLKEYKTALISEVVTGKLRVS